MKHFWISLSLFAITFAPDASAQGAAPVAPTEIQVGNALPGSFFATPEGHGPFPVIIILGGSSGDDGDARRLAPRLVAEGYAVFGLTYYSPAWYGRAAKFPELPSAFRDIPVERAAMAKQWLCARKDVNCGAIGIYGVSKGAEFALLAGSLIDGFAAIAAIVPSDVVWEGWGPGTSPGESSSFSWGGKGPLALCETGRELAQPGIP
ncbi:MAG: acyl-CoA thioester hydrolase/BAAT C-terminal domain-containing protein [Parvularculaceae bacterium]|nr:acyl-CoA thioester hydrolase/BAAT C-terminal domain-containing protein [Parvularculaceae bacterium]